MCLAGSGGCFETPRRNQHFHGKEFREHEMLARGVPRFPTFGKMYRSNRVRSLAAHQSGRGDRLPSDVWRLVQDPIDDAAQDALRKTFSRGIDRRDAPKMDRYLF